MKYTDDSYTFVLCSVKVSLSETPGRKLQITFSWIVYLRIKINFAHSLQPYWSIDADTPLTELFALTIQE